MEENPFFGCGWTEGRNDNSRRERKNNMSQYMPCR